MSCLSHHQILLGRTFQWYGLPCTNAFSHFPRFVVGRSAIARLVSAILTSLYCARSMPSMMYLYLCDFAPAISRISHLFQSQLFSRRPWCVCPTLLRLWLLRRGINISSLGRRTARLRLSAPSRARHAFLGLIQSHRFALPVCGRRQWCRRTTLRIFTCRDDVPRWLRAGQLSSRRVLWFVLDRCYDGRRL
jgi:hypothetical protein